MTLCTSGLVNSCRFHALHLRFEGGKPAPRAHDSASLALTPQVQNCPRLQDRTVLLVGPVSSVYSLSAFLGVVLDLDDGPSLVPLAEKTIVIQYKRALYRYHTMSLLGRAAVDPGLRQSTQAPSCPWALRADSQGTGPVLDRVGRHSPPRCESELTCRCHHEATSIDGAGHHAIL